jgi:hypothetical protein
MIGLLGTFRTPLSYVMRSPFDGTVASLYAVMLTVFQFEQRSEGN